MVASEFACATQFEKNASTHRPTILELPSDLPAATSIVEANVPVNASVSDTLEQQVCEDSCGEANSEPFTESNDDALDGLSLMLHEVCGDGTIVDMKGAAFQYFSVRVQNP